MWNETFTFSIEDPASVLRLTLMDKNFVGVDDYNGDCEIALSELRDQ